MNVILLHGCPDKCLVSSRYGHSIESEIGCTLKHFLDYLQIGLQGLCTDKMKNT